MPAEESRDALPFGPFAPRAHRTLEIGLREWVERQTGIELGYVEQLYTFGDRGRHAEPGGAHTLSVGYLALTGGTTGACQWRGNVDLDGGRWRDSPSQRLVGHARLADRFGTGCEKDGSARRQR